MIPAPEHSRNQYPKERSYQLPHGERPTGTLDVGRNANGMVMLRDGLAVSCKAKYSLGIQSSKHASIYMKMYSHTKSCMWMIKATLTITDKT